MYRRGDPLLMGAAIAYNSLFALVPLAAAFVAIITLLDLSETAFARFIDFLYSALPQDVAAFVESLFKNSESSIAGDQLVIVVVSILIALWSGSRAVYAIQKSLRLVQGVTDDRGYLKTRGIGIFVTIAGGASIMLGYAVLLLGESAWERLAEIFNLPDIGTVQIILSLLALAWIFGLLYIIYRLGPPAPVDLPAVTAGVVTVVLVLGTQLAVRLAPGIDSQALAIFGTMGVVLVWLYGVGVVVVAVPMMVGATRSAVAELNHR
jgi:membrane protein